MTELKTNRVDYYFQNLVEEISRIEQHKLVLQLEEIGVLLNADNGVEGDYVTFVCKNWDQRNEEGFVPEIEQAQIATGLEYAEESVIEPETVEPVDVAIDDESN